jgi:hypothetical protein
MIVNLSPTRIPYLLESILTRTGKGTVVHSPSQGGGLHEGVVISSCKYGKVC